MLNIELFSYPPNLASLCFIKSIDQSLTLPYRYNFDKCELRTTEKYLYTRVLFNTLVPKRKSFIYAEVPGRIKKFIYIIIQKLIWESRNLRISSRSILLEMSGTVSKFIVAHL